jgi:hypothetical protein
LMSSPEISSLSSGELRYDFGIRAGVDVVGPLVDAIIESITLEAQPVKVKGKGFQGNVTIFVQPDDFSNLLSLSSAVVVTEKGAHLPWLDWLLRAGDSIIIADFGVKYGAGLGRSGGGHMNEYLRPFKVKSSFSGTEDNNFISRAILRKQGELENIITRNM